jgi:Exonuclease
MWKSQLTISLQRANSRQSKHFLYMCWVFANFKIILFLSVTDVVAIDCEMVGGGESGKDNLLARVSVVNKFNEVLYDTFVQPREAVTDYRTQFSGVREADLATGNI